MSLDYISFRSLGENKHAVDIGYSNQYYPEVMAIHNLGKTEVTFVIEHPIGLSPELLALVISMIKSGDNYRNFALESIQN